MCRFPEKRIFSKASGLRKEATHSHCHLRAHKKILINLGGIDIVRVASNDWVGNALNHVSANKVAVLHPPLLGRAGSWGRQAG